jgi:hypothetical protein
MMERWGLPGDRGPVLSPPLRGEWFRVLGCSGGWGRPRG